MRGTLVIILAPNRSACLFVFPRRRRRTVHPALLHLPASRDPQRWHRAAVGLRSWDPRRALLVFPWTPAPSTPPSPAPLSAAPPSLPRSATAAPCSHPTPCGRVAEERPSPLISHPHPRRLAARLKAEARDPGSRGLGFGGEDSSTYELCSVKQSLGGVEPQRRGREPHTLHRQGLEDHQGESCNHWYDKMSSMSCAISVGVSWHTWIFIVMLN